MEDEKKTQSPEIDETTPAPAPSWSDPDGDGQPGISWPAAAIVIVIVAALATMLALDKIPDEVLVLLVGGIGEHVRGKIATARRGNGR